MKQYQTFPDSPGDSMTLDKLKALGFPEMGGLSFLDVGCNEGFFCGFAKFRGAKRAVGIDSARTFIDRAKERFPDCEFFCQGWEKLPEGQFDVILLASALHYAEDQPALIDSLVGRLSPDGVLILEMGIVPSEKNDWIEVERGIDRRFFPSMVKLKEVLSPYAWKWMGPSIRQAGDPVPRHVVHVSKSKPVAYLLLQPPAYGKSTIARNLFAVANVPVVSGDSELAKLARGQRNAAPKLEALVREEFSPFRLDRLMQMIFDQGLGADLVSFWVDGFASSDLAVDGFVPAEYHPLVEAALVGLGYIPVLMQWERPGPKLLPADEVGRQGEAFYLSMIEGPAAGNITDIGSVTPAGFVDEVTFRDDVVEIRGWAVDENGSLPAQFHVQHGSRAIIVENHDRVLRADVQRHLSAPHALFGFRMVIMRQLLGDGQLAASSIKVRAVKEGSPAGALFTSSWRG